jgi:hypothetical protein
MNVAMPKSKRDLADLLRAVMVIEAVSDRRPSASSDDIEKGLGMVRQAKETGSRRISSGRIAQSRRGDHGLHPKTLERILELEPDAWPVCSPIIWELVRFGRFHLLHPDLYYEAISKPVHNLLHLRTLLFGVQRLGSLFNPVTLVQLRCLVALGTLDAVTALWKLLLEAVEEGNNNILMIASHIPPALAMFHRRAEGKRTAILLFARMRQLILDRVKFDGEELSLSGYDLAAVAGRACTWALPDFGMLHHSALRNEARTRWPGPRVEAKETGGPARRGLASHYTLPDLPGNVMEWIERERAPLRKVRSRPIKSAKWTGRAPWPIEAINLPHPSGASWGKYAIAQFKAELGDYFCVDVP